MHFVAALLLCQSCLLAVEGVPARVSVLPRPVVEKPRGKHVVLARKGAALTIAASGKARGAVSEGMTLLKRRATNLGFTLSVGEAQSSRILLAGCSEEALSQLLNRHGIAQRLEPARISQAYHLVVDSDSAEGPCVKVQAAHERGLFYGLVSLCQLLEIDGTGRLIAPSVEIVDFPAIAHRLGKTGAENPPDLVGAFAAWLPLYKISQIGLQYHGHTSKHPEANFETNVKTLCPRLREAGTLESIVYFCPFRGTKDEGSGKMEGAYDFSVAADRSGYAEYLLRIMAQGAHGIEVDYNDWPGSSGVPISEVLNLACLTVKRQYPDAYVLYCPAARGEESYRGMSTPRLHQTLEQVPPYVWPLWTGLQTLIRTPLRAEEVEQWTRGAGRRPFLWVNRVAPDVKESFSQPVPGIPNSLVFRGDLLPRDLNRLFEGVHLNAGLGQGYNTLPGRFEQRALVYLGTAADFLWNAQKWDGPESYRRSLHFVEVMRPLVK